MVIHYFYENHHLANIPVDGSKQPGGDEHWIYYNTTKFSGKRLIVKPGTEFYIYRKRSI